MKPTHSLKCLDKTNDHKVVLGCGWLNSNGSITISLNPCVIMADNPNHVFTLFPLDKPTKPKE